MAEGGALCSKHDLSPGSAASAVAKNSANQETMDDSKLAMANRKFQQIKVLSFEVLKWCAQKVKPRKKKSNTDSRILQATLEGSIVNMVCLKIVGQTGQFLKIHNMVPPNFRLVYNPT